MPLSKEQKKINNAASKKRWNLRNPDKVKAYAKKYAETYYEINKEDLKSKRKERYQRQKITGDTYYQRNTEKVKKNNRDKYYRQKLERQQAIMVQ